MPLSECEISPYDATKIIGNTHIWELLLSLALAHKLQGTLLFSGPEGVGKRTAAVLLSQILLSIQNNPSNQISTDVHPQVKKSFTRQFHPSFMYIGCGNTTFSPDPYKANILLKDIGKIKEFISLKDKKNDYKIILIDTVHNLHNNACNALLKILEEPAVSHLFILIAHDKNSVPSTILSRCINFSFSALSHKELQQLVDFKKISIKPKNLATILELSNGSFKKLLWYNRDDILYAYEIIKDIACSKVNFLDLFDKDHNLMNIHIDEIFTIITDMLVYNLTTKNINKVSEVIHDIEMDRHIAKEYNLDKMSLLLTKLNKISGILS